MLKLNSGGFFVRDNSRASNSVGKCPSGLGLLTSCPSNRCSLLKRMEASTLKTSVINFATLTYEDAASVFTFLEQ